MIVSTQPCASTAPAPTSSDLTNSATPLVSLDSWPTQHQIYVRPAQVDVNYAQQLINAIPAFPLFFFVLIISVILLALSVIFQTNFLVYVFYARLIVKLAL